MLSKLDSSNVVRGILLKERAIHPQDDMVAWSYFYPRLIAFRELNIKALTLQYGTEQRAGVAAQDQPHNTYVHAIEHGTEFFVQPQDGLPAYYTTHEEYGRDYAHVQPNYQPESETSAQKNAPIYSDKNHRPFTTQYL